MRLWFTACSQWLPSTLGWSNSRESWQERIGSAVLLLLALALIWLRSRLSLAQEVVFWGLLVVALAALLRRGWLKLFGPVLFYDMVRVGRSSRYVLYRALYVSSLLAILSWIWLWPRDNYQGGNQLRMMAEFAESLFFTFMIVQLVLTVILTPAYVAGSIAEEKDRKTLEFLLATDLQNREIVLSKLISRLANLLLIVLAGLPVLSFLQFFGGIDPDLLLAAFAATGLIMLSLSGVSILASVQARKPRDAIVLTYLVVVAYSAVSLTSFGLYEFLKREYPEAASWSLLDLNKVPWSPDPFSLTLEVPVDILNSGDLILALYRLGDGLSSNQPLVDTLPSTLRDFAIFHGSVALLCATLAVLLVLRRVALQEAFGKADKVPFSWRILGRPQIGDQPMLWKEIFAEPGMRFKWLGKLALGLLLILSMTPPVVIISDAFYSVNVWRDRWEELGRSMNIYVRLVGTTVACLGLLAVAVRASGSLSTERDKQTFDGLLTTPLDANSILFAKWVGSIASIRGVWVWLGLIWAMGAATGGLQVVAIPFVVASWLVYAGVYACIGMWFSLICKTTLRSTMWTLLTTVFLGGGHWVMTGMCCFMPLALSRTAGGNDTEYLAKFLFGQTPPLVLGMFAFQGEEFRQAYMWSDLAEMIGFSVLGLGSWTVAGLILGTVLYHRFQEVTLRQPIRHPDRFVVLRPPPPPHPVLVAPSEVLPEAVLPAETLEQAEAIRPAEPESSAE